MTSDSEKTSRADVPRLPGFLTLAEAAQVLSMSRQMMHKLVFDKEIFEEVYRVGASPIYLLSETEVLKFKKLRGR